ncbi:hypothetical protein [Legionella jordanis]|uniref:Uncharacterized protein n=1 Tax=Legionella jordanis TaxID=456 RepID=A0A0W0VDW9_9GAMM|nr:hypothetical protein [Legionella jordanis]KTD18077.1 hypothetical protein Ljor_2383 [Legionella jordanis]RMX02237.1 hypothetical protein EAW55_08220 [Legionella jordanis]RMX21277.1 hypothetical protein EAS68_03645 [Legionella jordanis]VEH13831.1 Uncharacterised protein [Legionella jordanis]HAT8714212.1 hypothetical protein [Legionella jordanis]
MIKITRDEFLTLALIPDIADAKDIEWFKSNNENKLGLIIQLNSSNRYDYLVYEKDQAAEYILYPNEHDFSSIDYDKVYQHLEQELTSPIRNN